MPRDPNEPDAPFERSVPKPNHLLARHAPLDLVELAVEIEQAGSLVGTMTTGKLSVIAEQIRRLQDEARSLLEQAQHDAALHHAECRFRKHAGHVYHLYRGDGDRLYFSMLSPDDWQGAPPDAFEGSYRLEADMSWTPLEQVAAHDEAVGSIRKLLEANLPGRK